MTTKLTTVELTLIRDSLLKVTPTRDQADRLWDIIEKLCDRTVFLDCHFCLFHIPLHG